jgi:TonB family protein
MATTASHTATEPLDPRFSSPFLRDLHGLLEKAGRFTGAASAAIAFVEGDELVTKVSMGDCAPDPGSRSPISGSFTGLCVQQRDVQRCDDASKDSRVDAAACQALGIASMVIVPIAEKRNVCGVLAAFSLKPNAFSPTHVALLRTIADIVIELRKRYPAETQSAASSPELDAKNSGSKVESPLVHSAPDVKEPEPKKPASPVLPTPAPVPLQAKVEPPSFAVEKLESVVTPAAELHASMASIPVVPEPKKTGPKTEAAKPEWPKPEIKPLEAKPAPEKRPLGPVLVKQEPKPKIEHTVDLWKREPLLIKSDEVPDEYARLITDEPPKTEQEILSTAADIGLGAISKTEETPMFSSYGYNTSGAVGRPRHGGMPINKILVAIVALVAFGSAATFFFKHPRVGTKPELTSETVHAAAPPAPVVEPEPSTAVPAVTEPVSKPTNNGPGVAKVVKKTTLNLASPSTGNTTSNGEKKWSDLDPVPPKPRENALVVATNSRVPKKPAVADVEAPSAPADNSGVKNLLSNLKTSQPEAVFRSSSITAPQLLKSVPPQFPVFARQMHVQSDRVVLNATVEKNGSVTNLKVVHGKQVFVEPAISAVRQWKYKPAYLNGEPTPSTIEIVVNFVDQH